MSDLTPSNLPENGGSGAGALLPEPRNVPAGNGFDWIKQGFGYFKLQPFSWAVMAFLFFLLMVVMSTIPILSIFTNLVSPVFWGGMILGCAALDRGEKINVNYLYAAFSQHAPKLMIVGVLYGLGALLIGMVLMSVMGVGHATGAEDVVTPAAMNISGGDVGMFILLAMILMIPLLMAYVFAIPLVIFHDLGAIEAMKRSYTASIRNLGAIMVFFLGSGILGFVAAIPMGLGFVVLIPTLAAACYVGYKEILRA